MCCYFYVLVCGGWGGEGWADRRRELVQGAYEI